jgi:hypothetical protein
MLHGLILAAQDNPEAAGFMLKGIKGIFVAIGSIIAAIVCAVIAGVKGAQPVRLGDTRLVLQHLDADRHRDHPQREEIAQGDLGPGCDGEPPPHGSLEPGYRSGAELMLPRVGTQAGS